MASLSFRILLLETKFLNFCVYMLGKDTQVLFCILLTISEFCTTSTFCKLSSVILLAFISTELATLSIVDKAKTCHIFFAGPMPTKKYQKLQVCLLKDLLIHFIRWYVCFREYPCPHLADFRRWGVRPPCGETTVYLVPIYGQQPCTLASISLCSLIAHAFRSPPLHRLSPGLSFSDVQGCERR